MAFDLSENDHSLHGYAISWINRRSGKPDFLDTTKTWNRNLRLYIQHRASGAAVPANDLAQIQI